MLRGLAQLLAALCLLLLASVPAGAQEVLRGTEPVKIEADSVTYESRTDIYSGKGNVIITRGKDFWLRADEASFDRGTGEVEAAGSIHALVNGNDIRGSRASFNLDTQTGRVQQASLFVPEANYYISAEVMEKVGPERFTFHDAKITTCKGGRPAWSFSATDINMSLEGYASLHGMAFRIKDIPVTYSPFFLLPAKTKRATGLLLPEPGTSTLDGFMLDVPLFWAISESSDATLYASLKTKRGVMEGIEYRYALGAQSAGTIQASYLHDGLADEQFSKLDGTVRTNKDRWWVRGKADQALPGGVALRADFDAVSDEDYLREFNRGYQGFSASNRYFVHAFERSLQEDTDLVRESSLIAYLGQGVQYASAEARYYENLVPGQAGLTLQRLPTLRYQATDHPLLGGPVYWQLNTRYDDYWRNVSSDTAPKGQRLDLEPTLSMPLNAGPYLSFIPTASLRETMYLTDGLQDGRDVSGLRTREDFSVGGTLSTQVSRVFQTGNVFLPALKHILLPELTYLYRPKINQTDLPNFDPMDRVESANLLSLALTNDLIGKVSTGQGPTYLRLARLRISEGLDLNSLDASPGHPARPLAPAFAETEITYETLSVDADVQWGWYGQGLLRYGILAGWTHPAGHTVSLDYQFLRGVAEEVNLAGQLMVRHDFALYTRQRSSIEGNRVVESTFGVRYLGQCWGVDVGYTHQPFSEEFTIRFSLSGIGQVGAFGFSAGAF